MIQSPSAPAFNLRLRIAEAGVELNHLDALRGLHQAAVQHAAKRAAFQGHRFRRAAKDLLQGELPVLFR